MVLLIKLRNPWGYSDFAGDWWQGSPLWTDGLREVLNYHETEENKDIFFMSFRDYVHEFQRTCISAEQVLDESAHQRVPFRFQLDKAFKNT